MSFKVLVTSRSFGKISNKPIELLESAGIEMVTHPKRGPLEKHELIPMLQDVDGIIVGTDLMDAEVIDSAPKLKVISKHGVGIDNIDMDAAGKRNIVVTKALNTNVNAVAELAVTFMLGLNRKVVEADSYVREGKWGPMIGTELSSKTVGILGLGAIGKRVAALIKGFEPQILGFDPYAKPEEMDKLGIKLVTLDELLRRSDYISVHVPFTAETKDMISTAQFSMMKPQAFLVNLARGGVVNEQALAEALNSETIAGAAVDVFAQEPPSLVHPLFKAKNLIVSPHMGAQTYEALDLMSTVSAQNAIQVLNGEECPNIAK